MSSALVIADDVSTHSRLKAAGNLFNNHKFIFFGFNTQPPEGGWPAPTGNTGGSPDGFNTQPPEGGWADVGDLKMCDARVSTHSRLKAAGTHIGKIGIHVSCFNTQPPEGGWAMQAAKPFIVVMVSTHSRLKAAGVEKYKGIPPYKVSTHSRLKAAGFKKGRLKWI